MKRVVSIISIFVFTAVITFSVWLIGKNESKDISNTDNWVIDDSVKVCTLADFNLEDYVKLGDYNNMVLNVPKREVTDEFIDQQVDKALTELAGYEKIDDDTEVNDGDCVCINFVGTIDGEEFDGGSMDDAHVTIGSGSMIPGFEEGLIGAKVGETVTLDLKFPQDYYEQYAGKEVTFEVEIVCISKEIYYTHEDVPDEFILKTFGWQDKDSFYDYLKGYFDEQFQKEADGKVAEIFIDELFKVNECNAPEEFVTYRTLLYLSNFKQSAERQGLDAGAYIQSLYNESAEEFSDGVRDMIEKSIKQQMVLTLIAEKEGITIDEEGYEKYLNSFMTNYGYQSKDELYEDYSEEEVRTSYICKLVSSQLLQIATINYISE